MTSTPLAARIGVILAAGATAAILTAAPAVASTGSSTPPDCVTLVNAEKALTAAQNKAAAAHRADTDAHSKLTTDQANGASQTVIDADEAALGTAQSKMLLADNAVWSARGNVEAAKEAIQRDGVSCSTAGGTGGDKGGTDGTGRKGGGGGKGGSGGKGTSGGSDSGSQSSGPTTRVGSTDQTVEVNGGNSSSSAQVTTVVHPTVVLDPAACDHSQATTSGDEVTDVPTGSASTGAA